ncbi:MAG TPA: 4Fe-4S binding protein [Clostridia bacterium]|nr:4Fe-4S binding protein [Clostridia bacterium]
MRINLKTNIWIIYLRWILLALFAVLVTIASYLHIANGGGKSPSIHALCPFGGLESLYQLFTAGSFVSKIFAGTLILFLITLVVAILFRRSFCGLICPFGAIQEFFAKIGQKVFRKRLVMPVKVDRPLRYLKYVILIVTVFYAWKTAGLWMSPYDPWSAYAHLPEGLESVWSESAVGLILLGVTMIGSILYDRFFCKYLCPMGALYGIIGKLSPTKVSRDQNLCIDCGKCNRVCPMNLDVQHSQEVKSAECINCQACVFNCPKTGALKTSFGKKAIKPLVVMSAVMAVFFGSIFAFQAAGLYQLIPAKLASGEFISMDEVKGYMTIKDASAATNCEIDEFYKLYGIPENVPSDTMMKDISKLIPDYDLDQTKEALGGEGGSGAEIDKAETVLNIDAVKGKMTINDAAAAVGVSLKEFYSIFEIPGSVPSNTYMKDIGNSVPGYSFSERKESLK